MKRRNKSWFIQKAIEVHGALYDYSKSEYKSYNHSLEIVCPHHGSFWKSPYNHLRGQECPQCSKIRAAATTAEKFIVRAKAIHGDVYDYSKICYTLRSKKVELVCKNHGPFWQLVGKHLAGAGCPLCAKEERKYSNEEFVALAQKVHGASYSYANCTYQHSHTVVEILCFAHGPFSQLPVQHLRGNGCPSCTGNKRLSQEEWLTKAAGVHGDAYDYSLVEYKNSRSEVRILCKKHGEFSQAAGAHLKGEGCKACFSKRISHLEAIWLMLEGIPDTVENRQVSLKLKDGSRISVDGYMPSSGTAFQFHGSFYHGDPAVYLPGAINKVSGKKFSTLLRKTIENEQRLVDSGFKVVVMWESEFSRIVSGKSNASILEKFSWHRAEWSQALDRVRLCWKRNFGGWHVE